MDENSERHSMTTTYIHKENFGINMAYNMRHALAEFVQTWQKFYLGPGKLLEFEKVPFVLELYWNFVKSSLKI